MLAREHLSLLHIQHASSLLQVRVLVHTDVTKYLEFKAVDGSYVLSKGRVEKVPATDYEALRSPLLGLFEKRRLRSFLLCAPPRRAAARLLFACPPSRDSAQLEVTEEDWCFLSALSLLAVMRILAHVQ